jgi:hypothetical protein
MAIGRGGPCKSHKTHNMQYIIQNTAAAKTRVHKMYLFFYMALGHNDFDGG